MLVATRYTVSFDASQGVYVVRNKDAPLCPQCGALMSGYDQRKRKVIGEDGEIRIYYLRRLRCRECRQLHIELPDNLLPYKHYEAAVINAVKRGDSSQCPADDSTINRWQK